MSTPEIDRTIYPMPMFATFQVTDLAAAEAFYNAAGFVSLARESGVRTLELNLEESAASGIFHETRRGPAGETVPRWVAELEA